MNSKPYFIPSLPRLLQLAKDFGNGKLAKPTKSQSTENENQRSFWSSAGQLMHNQISTH
jgi:hypothetical protein